MESYQPSTTGSGSNDGSDSFGEDPSEGEEHLFAPATWACSGPLRVSDPCYDKKTAEGLASNAGTIPAVSGEWHSSAVLSSGSDRIASLTVWARGSPHPDVAGAWEPAPFSAGVDSGQCGIFDDSRYPEGEERDELFGGTLPGAFGLVDLGISGRPIGVVSSSGDGDGVYDVYVRMTAGRLADAVRVTFPADGYDGDGDRHEHHRAHDYDPTCGLVGDPCDFV
jgi:hypothetical protein